MSTRNIYRPQEMVTLDAAVKIARRSSIRTHKTGCLIMYRDKIVSNGWSHVPTMRLAKRSLHAELHAIARARHSNVEGCYTIVVTLNGKSGRMALGLPCLDCAIALQALGIERVYYSLPSGSSDMLYINDELRGLKVYSERDSAY